MPLLRRRASPASAAGDAAAYDEVAYPGRPLRQTHPARMAAQARLFGLPGFAVQECRMLELGCGDGGNLLPLAAAFPQATFVGLDLSGGAIERGRALAQEAGLANVRLEQADLGTVDAGSLGRFHAVAAHGVYSWVPAAVRDRLMALVGACLERDGVAYVSYNALPGGHLRALVRDVLRVHVAGLRDPSERIAAARELLRTLPSLSAWRGGPLEAHVKRTLERDDAGLFHDDMADVNDAVHVGDLDAHAREHGLRYFTEAMLSATVDGPRSDAVRRALEEHGDDRVAREQHLDLLELRLYRESLLCREGARPWPEPRPTHAGALHAAGRLHSKRPRNGVEEFRSPEGGALSTDHPAIKTALTALADAWPATVPVADLAAGDDAVAATLVQAHAGGLVDLYAAPLPIAARPGERPRVTALARLQARRGGEIANLRHEPVALTDDRTRSLIALLDGTRDTAELGMGERDATRALAQLAELGFLLP